MFDYWEERDGVIVCAWCGYEPGDFSHHKCRIYLSGSTPEAQLQTYLAERNAAAALAVSARDVGPQE